MAYNFPLNYQPAQIYYPQQQYMMPQAQTQTQAQNTTGTAMNSGIIWVQGEAGAKSYLVAPNTTVQLWDSEDQIIYLKSADASGMPSIKTLEYTIRDVTNNSKAVSDLTDKYITRDEYDSLKRQIDSLKGDIKKLREVNTHG